MKDNARIGRKITFTLFITYSMVSASLIATATINAIVGSEISGVVAWAGVPAAVIQLATAIGAFAWGLFMDRMGRRLGLLLGMGIGGFGALVSGAAIQASSFLLLLTGMALLGLARAAMFLGRFAAAEVNPIGKRGQAIANVVLGGTIGSIVGPLLVGPSGRLASLAGMSELTGPFGAGVLLFMGATLVIFFRLRPDPSILAREMASQTAGDRSAQVKGRSIPEILKTPAVIVAVVAMIISQMVMVMLMVITSLHMKDFDHSLSDISLVFLSHTLGMFAFSILSGRLADRLGREMVILAGAVFLVIASLGATLSPALVPLAAALFLLGLGWNFCYIGGSALLTDQLTPTEQSRTQGFNDFLVGSASALGSLGSGFVYSSLGYNIMGVIGAVFALVPLLLTLGWNRYRRRPAMATVDG